MHYIRNICSISIQDSFNKPGFSASLAEHSGALALVEPEYKAFIDAGQLRRLAPVLKMALACTSVSLRDLPPVDAIIFGTGLGCLADTHKFLEIVLKTEGLLPPTSFIQSTHNTIAGQVSLSLKNTGYNSTYSQNTISFERALEDAMLCLSEDATTILLGAADEYIPFLDDVKQALQLDALNISSGVTTLVLTREQTDSIAAIPASTVYHSPGNTEELITRFLAEHRAIPTLICYSGSPVFPASLDAVEKHDLNTVCGTYPTNSAFGVHLATDRIQSGATDC
ncbi:MAG: beta-ketoacyl synthase chain length factor, partial [Bacteroidota bacterium]